MSGSVYVDPKEGRRPEQPLHVLFIGEHLSRTGKYFKRADELVRCEHAADLRTGAEMMIMQSRIRKFDCVIVDMRRESDGAPMDVAALAEVKASVTFNIMAVPSQADIFREMEGVDDVLVNPVERADIISVVIESATPREMEKPEFIEIPRGFSSSEAFSTSFEPVIEQRDTETAPEPVSLVQPDQNMIAERPIPASVMAEVENLAVHAQIDRAKEVLAELSLGGEKAKPTSEVEDTVETFPPEEETKTTTASEQVETVATAQAPVVEPITVEETVESEVATAAVEETAEAPVQDEPVLEEPSVSSKPVVPAIPEKHAEILEPTPVMEKAKSTVTKGFESSLAVIQEVDQGIWQRFVPLANFLYKKLAIIVLSALFATFVAYGAMIVFFMGSSSWSLPFELSRGHALVEKIDRDLSSMSLRRNQVRQDLTIAQAEGVTAERSFRDGQLQLTLTKRTVEEEIVSQTATQLEITQHIDRLKRVINDFNQINGKGGFAKNLEGAYSKRLITRRSLNSGTLAVLETLHRMATVQNEISVKQLELRRVDRRLEFLRSLLEEIDQPEIRVITSAGSDLAHLAREVIEAKNRIATATKVKATAEKRIVRLDNSLEVITKNIDGLEATPAARARFAPVMVLFVPYANAGQVAPGEPLYTCVFSIIFCSSVGEVGQIIEGETTAVHPLFGKPMRGSFVEAKFPNPDSVREELLHAGSAPMGL